MATGELNPSHYPARRAAQVIQHHLNTHYGSPYRLFMLHKVHRGYAEDVADSGRKYQLDVSVEELLSNVGHVFFLNGTFTLFIHSQESHTQQSSFIHILSGLDLV
uniref:Cystatin LXN-type domain-containing protein n=1 Tax=Monopterus albus TaxID=43700 RepID=A0A3Q3JMU8_MONAL